MLFSTGRGLFNSANISLKIQQFKHFIPLLEKCTLSSFHISPKRKLPANPDLVRHDTIKQNPRVEGPNGAAAGLCRVDRMYGR